MKTVSAKHKADSYAWMNKGVVLNPSCIVLSAPITTLVQSLLRVTLERKVKKCQETVDRESRQGKKKHNDF